MSEANTETTAPAAKPKAPAAPVKVYPRPTEKTALRALRKHLRKKGREKRALKLVSDKEFAKTFFEARSKRSTEKKSAFRKKKSKKK